MTLEYRPRFQVPGSNTLSKSPGLLALLLSLFLNHRGQYLTITKRMVNTFKYAAVKELRLFHDSWFGQLDLNFFEDKKHLFPFIEIEDQQEVDRIKEIQELGWALIDVDGDGNCGFYSIALGLANIGNNTYAPPSSPNQAHISMNLSPEWRSQIFSLRKDLQKQSLLLLKVFSVGEEPAEWLYLMGTTDEEERKSLSNFIGKSMRQSEYFSTNFRTNTEYHMNPHWGSYVLASLCRLRVILIMRTTSYDTTTQSISYNWSTTVYDYNKEMVDEEKIANVDHILITQHSSLVRIPDNDFKTKDTIEIFFRTGYTIDHDGKSIEDEQHFQFLRRVFCDDIAEPSDSSPDEMLRHVIESSQQEEVMNEEHILTNVPPQTKIRDKETRPKRKSSLFRKIVTDIAPRKNPRLEQEKRQGPKQARQDKTNQETDDKLIDDVNDNDRLSSGEIEETQDDRNDHELEGDRESTGENEGTKNHQNDDANEGDSESKGENEGTENDDENEGDSESTGEHAGIENDRNNDENEGDSESKGDYEATENERQQIVLNEAFFDDQYHKGELTHKVAARMKWNPKTDRYYAATIDPKKNAFGKGVYVENLDLFDPVLVRAARLSPNQWVGCSIGDPGNGEAPSELATKIPTIYQQHNRRFCLTYSLASALFYCGFKGPASVLAQQATLFSAMDLDQALSSLKDLMLCIVPEIGRPTLFGKRSVKSQGEVHRPITWEFLFDNLVPHPTVVIPVLPNGTMSHAFCVVDDLIFDSITPYALKLQRDSLQWIFDSDVAIYQAIRFNRKWLPLGVIVPSQYRRPVSVHWVQLREAPKPLLTNIPVIYKQHNPRFRMAYSLASALYYCGFKGPASALAQQASILSNMDFDEALTKLKELMLTLVPEIGGPTLFGGRSVKSQGEFVRVLTWQSLFDELVPHPTVVIPVLPDGTISHAFCVVDDLIFDSVTSYALKLQNDSLQWMFNNSNVTIYQMFTAGCQNYRSLPATCYAAFELHLHQYKCPVNAI